MGKSPERTCVLQDGSRVGIVGGGPAGSLSGYFLLDIAQRVGLNLDVTIHEWRDFSRAGPGGCNMCGGIVSESLVESLAAEGINLPPTVVRRAIDSYVMHMDVGTVRFDTPLQEMRIAAAHRGAGPRGSQGSEWESFDDFLLTLAKQKGARVVQGRVDGVSWENGRPVVRTRDDAARSYDLLVAAVGVNSRALELFREVAPAYRPPLTRKTYICEFHWGREAVEECLGSSMHVFLLNIPRLEFAAIIPKGDYATLCMLGRDIDTALAEAFLDAPEVRACLPSSPGAAKSVCRCFPRISVRGATRPFADRVVFVGDCGATRLYKDGIGAAYRTAKAAAVTAVFEGVSGAAFRAHYGPVCRAIEVDNRIGELVFAITRQIQRVRLARRGLLHMVTNEQDKDGPRRRMSRILWDTFTGSASYRDVFVQGFHPGFLTRLVRDVAVGNWPLGAGKR